MCLADRVINLDKGFDAELPEHQQSLENFGKYRKTKYFSDDYTEIVKLWFTQHVGWNVGQSTKVGECKIVAAEMSLL